MVLPHDRGLLARGDDERVDDDLLGGTVLRHFQLSSPVARLPSGVCSTTSAAPLIPTVARPLRLSPPRRRTPATAVDVATVALATNHDQHRAKPAVELSTGLFPCLTWRNARLLHPAKNWTSPRPWGYCPCISVLPLSGRRLRGPGLLPRPSLFGPLPSTCYAGVGPVFGLLRPRLRVRAVEGASSVCRKTRGHLAADLDRYRQRVRASSRASPTARHVRHRCRARKAGRTRQMARHLAQRKIRISIDSLPRPSSLRVRRSCTCNVCESQAPQSRGRARSGLASAASCSASVRMSVAIRVPPLYLSSILRGRG
jgi:hypothetical protein